VLSINPWEVIDGSPSHLTLSWSEAEDLASSARARMSTKLLLQYNGLGDGEDCLASKGLTGEVYCYLAAVDGPKGFQTETWELLGGERGLFDALDRGVAMGANVIELPSGYEGIVDVARLASIDAALEAAP
jgi:hypothetical protein